MDPASVTVVVEIPGGSRNKYEMDHATGSIYLDRMLFTATRYPADYGFIEGTLGEDGDPLDALVLVGEPTFPGCRILARPVGVFGMRDEKGQDDKILCVPLRDPASSHLVGLGDLRHTLLAEIEHFFAVYKDLEDKKVETQGFQDREAALVIIDEARRRAGEKTHRENGQTLGGSLQDRSGPRSFHPHEAITALDGREFDPELNRFRACYNDERPHRALRRHTPAEAFSARPRSMPSGVKAPEHARIRRDRIDGSGAVTLRHDSRLHHIKVGRRFAGTRVVMLVAGLDVRIVSEDGELLRELVLDPSKGYQPLGGR